MSHKPKPVQDHYVESFSINSKDLSKRLKEKSVSEEEIKRIVDLVSDPYFEKVQEIVAECNKDMMALERVPSPLKLFVDCVGLARKSIGSESSASALLEKYALAWEDWMQ